MTAKEIGKGKAGRKAAVNEIPTRIPIKTIWEEVVEKEELAEKKRSDRELTFLGGLGNDRKS